MPVKLNNLKSLFVISCLAIKSYSHETTDVSINKELSKTLDTSLFLEDNRQNSNLSPDEKHDSNSDASYLDAMEKLAAEKNNNIKRTLYQSIIKALKKIKEKNPNETLNNSLNSYIQREKHWNNGYGLPDGSDGYFYLPQDCNTAEKIFAHLEKCDLPRQPMTLESYFSEPYECHTLVVGSGLCQEMLQPLTSGHLFQHPFYMNMHKSAIPDIVGEFGFNFYVRKDVEPYLRKFDSVYLDNFLHMMNNDVLQASYISLKAGGLLWGNLRIYAGATERDIEEYKQIIEKKLGRNGFKNISFSDNKEAIRHYGYPYYHFYAYKKHSS